MAALRDLATQLIDGDSITDSVRIYVLGDIAQLSDGSYKATLTSESMRYSHYEPARSKDDAVYRALLALQMMGRFMSYNADEVIEKQKQRTKIHREPDRVEKSVQLEMPSIINPAQQATKSDMSDPAMRERNLLIEIVSRTT